MNYRPIPDLTVDQALALSANNYSNLPDDIRNQVIAVLSAHQMSQQWEREHPQPDPFKGWKFEGTLRNRLPEGDNAK